VTRPPRVDANFATTLAHGLQVVECFRVGVPALTNKELAEQTGLSKATISRLTYTLQLRGLLVFDTQLRRYRLGLTALTLGYPLLSSFRIRQVARDRMQQLASDTGGSVSLGMRDRTQMVYIETCRGHDLIAFRPDIGASLSMTLTAMGRAWLAQASDVERNAVIAKLKAAEPPERWQAQAASVDVARRDLRQCGFCISRGEWWPDVQAVAVPLRALIDGEVLVFNCGVPTRRLGGRELARDVAPRLLSLVRDVENELNLA